MQFATVLRGIEQDCNFWQAGMTTHTAKTTVAFDVLLTVHLSIILTIDQLNAQILVL